ncbi:cytochrome c oxidase assembly factor 8 [Platichthys flesus]|uniref:cytochrome c oxidase assembly factor 8 n=1 Tax=Platichthys flesus TaxID=8260 RepID=UPI002DBC24A2|nr:cytochrome c oxidase assembly factor 8 [Platichthys flesus]
MLLSSNMCSVSARRSLTWRSFRSAALSTGTSRSCSSQHKTQQGTAPKRSIFRPPPSSTCDWIGPPNPLSNLRPIVYHIAENESELQRRLRNLRQETEDWNHEFWAKQNIAFNKDRDSFITSQLKTKGLTVRDEQGKRRCLNSEEMAVFYKMFLDNNRTRHMSYNKEWYRRNFTITLLMARVALTNMWTTVRHSKKKTSSPASGS